MCREKVQAADGTFSHNPEHLSGCDNLTPTRETRATSRMDSPGVNEEGTVTVKSWNRVVRPALSGCGKNGPAYSMLYMLWLASSNPMVGCPLERPIAIPTSVEGDKTACFSM